MEIKIFDNKDSNLSRDINSRLDDLKIALPKLIHNKHILKIITKYITNG
jgi:hypothetical protein